MDLDFISKLYDYVSFV